MNSKSDPSHKLIDKDLAALFERQEIVVPESLDDSILKASRQAVVNTQPSLTPMKKYSPLFAIAAVLILAFTLSPLVLNAPTMKFHEDSSELIQESNIEESLVSAQEISLETSADADTVVRNTATKKSPGEAPAPTSVKARVTAPIKAPAPVSLGEAPAASVFDSDPNDLALSRSLLPSNQSLMFPSVLNEEFAYRQLPENWLSRIKQLLSTKQLSKARSEYDLFREEHPSYRLDFEFPNQ